MSATPTSVVIYVFVAWNTPHSAAPVATQVRDGIFPYMQLSELQSTHTSWHEFQLKAMDEPERPEHFWKFKTTATCERYRTKLVDSWLKSPFVPFSATNLIGSRCAAWTPDLDDPGTDI